MSDLSKKSTSFNRRNFIALCIKSLFFGIIFSRFYFLQVKQRGIYKTMSDSNRIRVSVTPPIRGLILDRYGDSLASNYEVKRLVAHTRNVKEIEAIVQSINKYIKKPLLLSKASIVSLVNQTQRNTHVTLVNDLSWEDTINLEMHEYNIDNIAIKNYQQRIYKIGPSAAHITGYVSMPTNEEVKRFAIPNYQDFVIGKNGIERFANEKLMGRAGAVKTEVDSRGNIVRLVGEDVFTPGDNINLSISKPLQEYLANLITNLNAAVVIMCAQTGKVFAMHSTPSYDPNAFVSGISVTDWQKLISNTDAPLINKCISTSYPPGSTFKIITALAALESGIISKDKRFKCTGECEIAGKVFHCWKRGGHGDVEVISALAQSCNVYFYKVAELIGIKHISKIAYTMGLGDKTGIELPFEITGLVPTQSWKQSKYKNGWLIGDTVNTSIGQGYLLTTIMQLALMVTRLITGCNTKPSIFFENHFEEPHLLDIQPANLELVRFGLYSAFNRYIGKNYNERIDAPRFELSGKSGTAQVISLGAANVNSSTKDHGLFVGFAPYQKPKYVIASLVEHGGWGSASAMPIVRNLMLYLLKNPI